jgi:hypothetical protein
VAGFDVNERCREWRRIIVENLTVSSTHNQPHRDRISTACPRTQQGSSLDETSSDGGQDMIEPTTLLTSYYC